MLPFVAEVRTRGPPGTDPLGTRPALPRVTSCQLLRQEHDLIWQVVGAVEMLTAGMQGCRGVPTPFSGAIDFFASFVDGCHEVKEEEGLLPVLAGYGVPAEDSVTGLLAEHAEGRRLVGALRRLPAERLESEAVALVQAYLALLRRHMARENAVLFPYAERVLSPSDETRLARVFAEVEQRAMGPGGREVVLALAGAVTEACHALKPPSGREKVLVRDIMRTRTGMVLPHDSLASAVERMRVLGSRELPVVEHGRLVGILARSDMEPHVGHHEWTTVRTAMSADPVTVDADAPIATVALLLLERSFNGVPVVEGGRLVGMVARRDLLRVLAGDDPQSPT